MPTVRNSWWLAVAVAFVIVNVLVIECIAYAISSLGRGEYLTVVVVLGFGLALATVETTVLLIKRGKVAPRVEFSDCGTTIRPDRFVEGLNKVGLAGGYIAVATFAIFGALGKIDLPMPSGRRHYHYLVAAIVLTIFGIPYLWKTFKQGGVSFILLTTSGFDMSKVSSDMSKVSSSMQGRWDDVVDITDRRPEKGPPFRATIFVKFRDGQLRSLIVDPYTPGGDAMRELVRYYWLNPDRRDELTDGTALERLRRGPAR